MQHIGDVARFHAFVVKLAKPGSYVTSLYDSTSEDVTACAMLPAAEAC